MLAGVKTLEDGEGCASERELTDSWSGASDVKRPVTEPVQRAEIPSEPKLTFANLAAFLQRSSERVSSGGMRGECAEESSNAE